MADMMKRELKRVFLEILHEKPLGEITVKEITERAGVNRNSFYYHYSGINELVEEILTTEADRLIEERLAVGSIEEALKAMIQNVRENEVIVRNIYSSVSRMIFEKYLWTVSEYVVEMYMKNSKEAEGISEFDREIIKNLFVSTSFGLAMNMFRGGYDDKMIEKSIHRVCELLAGIPRDIVNRAAKEEN